MAGGVEQSECRSPGQRDQRGTALDWLQEAAQHAGEIESLLLANYELTRAQLDALWTYVGHKGEKGGIPSKMIVAPSGGGR